MPGSTARCRIPSEIARVVAGADRVETEGQRAVEHRGELDLLVAAQARVRGTARRVLGDEILHHVAVEALGHVPHVERDADHVGGPPRVPRVLQRAAAAGPGPVRRRVRRQRQMDAGHLVTRVHRTSRGRRGVHPARHRREHPKPTHPKTLPAPSTTPRPACSAWINESVAPESTLLRVRGAADSNAECTGGRQVGQKGRISVSGAAGLAGRGAAGLAGRGAGERGAGRGGLAGRGAGRVSGRRRGGRGLRLRRSPGLGRRRRAW